MSLRFAALALGVLMVSAVAFVLVGCGDADDDSGGESLTPELVVPPASQKGSKELADTASATATSTPIPTPTSTPTLHPTSTPMPTATIEPTPTEVVEKPKVKIPNRGYNSMGSDDALIVMFEFSDFL